METLTLVIVEDEAAHFHLMKRAILKEYPYARIFHFEDATSCMEQLLEIHPDVLILDYLMPGMDGLKFMRNLKREKSDIPVIMITGQGDETIAVKAIKLGAWDYLVKTADFFSLLPTTLEKVLRARRLKISFQEAARLNSLLLDTLPHPAIMVRRDRIILTANRIAKEMGASVGEHCWRTWGQCRFIPREHQLYLQAHEGDPPPEGTHCVFCKADQALKEGRQTHLSEVSAFERLWENWWIPIGKDKLLHYAIDITERRAAERALQESEKQLRFLSSRLLSAQEEERRRIACELHDSIGSSLSAIKFSVENTLKQMEEGKLNPESLKAIATITQETIHESRKIMTALRPSLLDDLGLLVTIKWFCRQMQSIYGSIHIEEQVEIAEEDIPESLKIVIFRIMQEAFHNITKYSEAEWVDIALVKNGKGIELTIEDNGNGFDLDATLAAENSNRGLGLTSMKERAELSGGTFAMRSVIGEGTKIRAVWPLSS